MPFWGERNGYDLNLSNDAIWGRKWQLKDVYANMLLQYERKMLIQDVTILMRR